jgi:hypothetical protein
MAQILYQPQYRVSGTTTWINWGTAGGVVYGGPGEISGTSVTIGGGSGPALTQGTSYDFQILADNGSGTTASSIVTATTLVTSIITGISLSNSNVLNSAASGSTVGTISVTLSSGTFSGSVTVGSGNVTGESAPGATATPGTGSIVCGNTPGAPGIGNTWTISSAGVIALNGTPNTGTSGVTEIYYINHAVYQFNGTSWYGPMTSTSTGATALGSSPVMTPALQFALSGSSTLVTADASLPAGTYVISITASQSGLASYTQNFTITSATSTQVGPAASGTFINADFTNISGTSTGLPQGAQTVTPYLYGVGLGVLYSYSFPAYQNTNFNVGSAQATAIRSLNLPLARVNGFSSGLESQFNGASTASDATLTTWLSFFPTNFSSFFPSNCRVIFGLGGAMSTWTSSGAYAGFCSAVATWFNTHHSGFVWGFEIGNESTTWGSPPAVTTTTYQSYFNAGSVAIKAVNSNFKVIGPNYANSPTGVSAFISACGANCDVICAHSYPGPSTAAAALAGGTSGNTVGTIVGQLINGSMPISVGEWNQNGNPGTGGVNAWQCQYIGAVFNASAILQGLNTSANFQMAANWEIYSDSDYGLVGASDAGGGSVISPVGYFMSQAAAVMYGTRASCVTSTNGSGLSCLAATGGPGVNNFAVMLINPTLATSYTGQVALSHWPVNTTGTATINQWLIGGSNTTASQTTVSVTAGLTASLTVPAASVMILYA